MECRYRVTGPKYLAICRLYPSSPQPYCFAGACLSVHMMCEVLWDPKRRRSWVFCTACANFFIEPPPDTQRKERQGERRKKRNMGCCVLLSAVHSPPTPPPLPHLGRHFTCPWPWLSGPVEQGRAPPPHTPTPLDSLRLQQ
jgi:hypothetical protein